MSDTSINDDAEANLRSALNQFLDMAEWASHNPIVPDDGHGRDLDVSLAKAFQGLCAAHGGLTQPYRGLVMQEVHDRLGRLLADAIREREQARRANTTQTS